MVYDNSLSVSLPELVDLALGSPENGAVNFNILHSLLHIMIRQMELTSTRAEFINGDVVRMDRLMRRAPKEPYVKLEEYIMSKNRSKEERTGEFSAAQLGMLVKADRVLVHREPDSVKETVVVVMPYKHQPYHEFEVQHLRVEETQVSSTFEKGEIMSSGGTSRAQGDGRRPPTRPGPGGDIVRRKKPGPAESAAVSYPESGPSAPTQAGFYPPSTAYPPTAPYTASPYAAPIPTTPYPFTDPYPFTTSHPAEAFYPATSPRSPTAYASPPPSYPVDAQYMYHPYWYPVTGVRPEDLVPGTPEYITGGIQNPEAVGRVEDSYTCQPQDCESRRRKPPVEETPSGPRGALGVPRPPTEEAPIGQAGDGAPPAAGRRPAEAVGYQPNELICPGLPAKPTMITPGYRGAMARLSSESLPVVPWAGGMALPGTLPGDASSVGGLRKVPALSGGTGARESASRETLSRLGVVETDVRQLWKLLEENRFLGPPLADELCDELRDNLSTLEKQMWELGCRLANAETRLESIWTSHTQGSLTDVTGWTPESLATEIRLGVEKSNVVKSLRADIEDIKKNCLENEELLAMGSERKPVDSLCRCVKDVKNIKKSLEALTGGDLSQIEKDPNFLVLDSSKFNSLEERLYAIEDQTVKQNKIVQSLSERVELVVEQSSDMEREIGLIAEKFLHEGKTKENALDLTGNISGLSEVFNMIHLLQCNIEDISNTCAKLMQERDEKAKHMLSLESQLRALMQIKADRDELDEALLFKADHVEVNRKVSHDQFDSALEDLTRGLHDAVTKLSQQELLWQQALDELQQEVGNKLDSDELAPLKEIMNKKLKNLNERLKNLAKVRKQAEAAGTKKKLLKDVTCISCDVGAVMRTELDGNVPVCPPLPPNQSIKPYLTYELDMIRKERKLTQGKHLIHLEEALTDQKQKQIVEEGKHTNIMKEYHICNRYCGGSHTLNTAYQRAVRMGHFVTKEVGPECLQLLPEKAPSDAMLDGTLPEQGKMKIEDTKKQEKNALTLPKTEKK